jgi:hypothetical protein
LAPEGEVASEFYQRIAGETGLNLGLRAGGIDRPVMEAGWEAAGAKVSKL